MKALVGAYSVIVKSSDRFSLQALLQDHQKSAAAGLKMTCTVCRSMMPDPKTYKQHFENKHPKNPIPQELLEALTASLSI